MNAEKMYIILALDLEDYGVLTLEEDNVPLHRKENGPEDVTYIYENPSGLNLTYSCIEPMHKWRIEYKGMMMKEEGMAMMGQVKKGSMAMGRAGHVGSYTGNNMKLTATGMMGESAGQERKNLLTDMPIDTRGASMKMSPMDRQKYENR